MTNQFALPLQRYSLANCLYEATVQKIEADCSCKMSNFVDMETPNPNLTVCYGKGKACMNDLIGRIGQEKFVVDYEDGDKVKECFHSCVDETYDFLLTQSAYPNKESFYR